MHLFVKANLNRKYKNPIARPIVVNSSLLIHLGNWLYLFLIMRSSITSDPKEGDFLLTEIHHLLYWFSKLFGNKLSKLYLTKTRFLIINYTLEFSHSISIVSNSAEPNLLMTHLVSYSVRILKWVLI